LEVAVRIVARARTADELGKVNDEIHDRWLSTEAIEYDLTKRQLQIPIWNRIPHDKSGAPETRTVGPTIVLRIGAASEVQNEDDQGICWYDLNIIVYDGRTGWLDLETNIPTRCRVRVDYIDVTVFEAD
jgi:hypothetical protein